MSEKKAVPAVKINKGSDHKSKIETMKRAMSQPDGPTLMADKDRNELQRSIRASKKATDLRGGTAHQDIVKESTNNKEIFEYSPMVQNNYLEQQELKKRTNEYRQASSLG